MVEYEHKLNNTTTQSFELNINLFIFIKSVPHQTPLASISSSISERTFGRHFAALTTDAVVKRMYGR